MEVVIWKVQVKLNWEIKIWRQTEWEILNMEDLWVGIQTWCRYNLLNQTLVDINATILDTIKEDNHLQINLEAEVWCMISDKIKQDMISEQLLRQMEVEEWPILLIKTQKDLVEVIKTNYKQLLVKQTMEEVMKISEWIRIRTVFKEKVVVEWIRFNMNPLVMIILIWPN